MCVCMYFKKKLYILLVSASLLRFLISATIKTETFLWQMNVMYHSNY
jgi:hypothetical protein